jgi:peptidoglycan pentaglycine glycine transferase (the first glycine)
MPQITARVLPEISSSSALGTEWEKLVCANEASGVMQSLPWAEVKRRQGLPSFHVGLFEDDRLFGGAIFYTSKKRNGAGILVAPEGPVLPWQDPAKTTQALGILIDTIQSNAAEMGIMAMRIEPRLAPPPMKALREFGKAPADLVPKDTLYIDLTPDRESLLRRMKPKGRYNLGLAERHGVRVYHDTTDGAIERFYSIMLEASERDGFALEPFSFFQHLVSGLSHSGIVRLFFSEHEGDLLGTLLLITYGDRGTYLYGGITNQKRHLMGGYALQWAAMLAAKDAGCALYDLYGYAPIPSPDHAYARFSQFKGQFGGELVRFIGAQDYFFLDNLADAFVKAARETQANSLTGVM